MDSIGKAGFDHPCKHRCSGWAQGRERGAEDERVRSAPLLEALRGVTAECLYHREEKRRSGLYSDVLRLTDLQWANDLLAEYSKGES